MTVRENVEGRCGVPWPVCPVCLGEGLSVSAGRATCDRCGGSWPEGERVPCPAPATVVLSDAAGEKGRVCESHAAHPSAAELRKALRLVPPPRST